MLWCTSNIPHLAMYRTWAVFSRSSSSAFSIVCNQFCYLANNICLYCTWTELQYTCQIIHKPPSITTPGGSVTVLHRYCRDCGLAANTRACVQLIWHRWWEQWFFDYARFQRHGRNEPDPNRILHAAICIRIGQLNFKTFDKWKKLYVAGHLGKQEQFIIWG